MQAESLMALSVGLKPRKERCYTLVFGMDLVIDPDRREVTLKGQPLKLTSKEFERLFCLASHAGQVLSREQLYSMVWNSERSYNVDEIVKSHIKALRRKLTPADRKYIKNVWGIGYRFLDEENDTCSPE